MFPELEEKASVYFLFSRLFREPPGPCLLKEIVEEKLLTEEIAVEHTTLFVVAGECYIPPYESYYCDTLSIDTSTACSPYFQQDPFPERMKGFIGGPSAATVRKFYEENGFILSHTFHDLPDHIACELELMGRFYQEGKVDQAHEFFQNHLGRWVFTFLEELEKQKRSLFYQKVAVSLKQFLKQETSEFLLKTEGGSQND